jgi:hypothetical protein
MKALLGTDVLLDVALARAPHARDSIAVQRWVEGGDSAAVAWHSLTHCAHLLKGGGRSFLESLLRLVEVATVGTADARRALSLPMADVDDALQAAAALAWQADFSVTRNTSDYGRSPVPAITPAAFLRRTSREK